MGDNDDESQSRQDAELEREIRSKRKFSLSEAIGRAGGDLLKGASPVTRKRQAEIEVKRYLQDQLNDTEGALRAVLLRQVTESEILLEASYEKPLAALTRIAERLLDSEERLRRFVDKVDTEWGRIYLERPHFERGDGPPDRGDPYTLTSVRATLTDLLARLGE